MPDFKKKRARDRIRKRAKQGFRGYPIVSIAFYGPDDKTATKVVVACMEDETESIASMERWSSTDGSDLRKADDTALRIDALLKKWGARSTVMVDAIIGCPHEEGIDYPEGEICPQCPFWKNRDRWNRVFTQ